MKVLKSSISLFSFCREMEELQLVKKADGKVVMTDHPGVFLDYL